MAVNGPSPRAKPEDKVCFPPSGLYTRVGYMYGIMQTRTCNI